MNLTRCSNGHFYDADRFQSCPHCSGDAVTAGGTPVSDELTMKLTEERQETMTVLQQQVAEAMVTEGKDEQKTVGYYDMVIGKEPVVGWLICTKGGNFGEDFRLKAGRNFIGRSEAMDIALSGDVSVSREKHAVILFEPKENVFLVQPGDSKELSYLNGKVVLSAVEIKAYDVLTVGETDLTFIPFCSDSFRWEDVKKEKEEK